MARAMQHPRNRRFGPLLTSVLTMALAIAALSLPAAASAGKHACCVRMTASCPVPQLQCCVTRAPSRPTQAPPEVRTSSPAPDLTASVPHALTAHSWQAITLVTREGSPLSGAIPLYLLHSALLV
jgi:hypothetical protein